ncbi:DNA polymerase Y family protein [Phenylobacterium sp.]|uniref:DNA polymerase Y family protein n=1 Tax=Phenylobacterium sp. TaxID=1871053 RepID=UPI002FCBBE86
MARILCAWSPNWAIANWRRRNPSDSQPSPFGLIETVKAVRRLSAVDKAAAAAGLFPGQKATDAAALVPNLVTAEAETEADAAALTALVDWSVRFSHAVAAAPPDGLFLDITGVDHLWGGEAELVADFRSRLARNDLFFRCAVADTPGAAWALAHYGKGAEIIAPPNGQADLLAYLPPAALRLEPEAAAQIERLGLRYLFQIIGLPRAPFARRFGKQALLRLDQAMGRAEEALTFRRPPNPWFARLAFFEPISVLEDLQRVSRDVAAKLCARLELESRGAKRFELTFHRLDGKAYPLTIGLSIPGRDPARIAKLFAPKLETVDPGFGIEVVTITAEAVEVLSGRQARLDAAREAALEEGLAPLVDRLVNRLGEDRVWKSAPVESHVPEQSAQPGAPLGATAAWNPETPRPLRLFRRPEPLDLVLALTPDDPPRQFQWRKQTHRVRHAEGPERIGAEWWRGEIDEVRTDQVRDYYRVEDQEGGRFWVYREGLYEAGVPAKWFLHGLFG